MLLDCACTRFLIWLLPSSLCNHDFSTQPTCTSYSVHMYARYLNLVRPAQFAPSSMVRPLNYFPSIKVARPSRFGDPEAAARWKSSIFPPSPSPRPNAQGSARSKLSKSPSMAAVNQILPTLYALRFKTGGNVDQDASSSLAR